MLIDSRLEFCDDTALVGSSTNAEAVGYQVDLLEPNQVVYGVTPTYDLPGNSDHAYFVLAMGSEGVTSGTGGSTVRFELVSADDVTLATNAIIHAATADIVKTSLAARAKLLKVKLPKGNYRKYLGVRQVASAAVTAGKIDAYITSNPPDWAPFTDGVSN